MTIAQYFRFAENSGDNHPKHFRKLIMYHVHWYYENTDFEVDSKATLEDFLT
jgi:hypothetical protein